MLSCEHARAQMLDHLFGLLEEADDRAFQAHIVGCAACAAALRQERDFQGLLGRAARAQFPEVHFAAPAAASAERGTRSAEPQAIPTSAVPSSALPAARASGRPSMQRIWTRWAVAAGLLLVLAGLGGPAVRQFIAWRNQSAIVEEHLTQVKRLEDERRTLVASHDAKWRQVDSAVARAADEHQTLVSHWRIDWEGARTAVESKRLFVRVTGPERPQPGAPNEWTVETLTHDYVYQPAKVEIVLKDQAGSEVWRETKDRAPTPPTIRLPIKAWENVKSGDQLTISVKCRDDVGESMLCEQVPLARPVYVTQLATDKPMYNPRDRGDTVFFRSLTLERSTFQPPAEDLQLQFDLIRPDGSRAPVQTGTTRLIDPETGKTVLGPDGQPLRGVASGVLNLPPGCVGGEYTLVVSEINQTLDEHTRQPVAKVTELDKRRFLVNNYVPEKLYKKLEFDGKSYGPGDLVQVKAEASRAEGVLKNVPVSVSVLVDGQEVKPQAPRQTDDKGIINVRFRVPSNVSRGEGTIAVTFQDKDGPDPIVRPIPLIGKQLQVEFYPEGGELVEGIESRIYFQVRTPKGKPADLKGVITDGTNVIAEVTTLTDTEQAGVSRGQGKFTLKPEPGKHYALQVKTPVGIEPPQQNVAAGTLLGGTTYTKLSPAGFPLPAAKTDGVVLTVPDGVTGPKDTLTVRLQAPVRKELVVGAYARGRLLGHERVTAEPGNVAEVKLHPEPETDVGGVTRVTVFEELKGGDQPTLKPAAERLVYRKPGKTLLLNAQPNQSRYNPSSPVELHLAAHDENEKPVPAVLMVACVNQSVITMADMKTDRLPPSHFLLAGEVDKPEDLEFADFLLGHHPKAAEALDLLLGTQGWRRFAEQGTRAIPGQPRPDVERLLVATGKSRVPIDTFRQEEEKVEREYRPKLEQVLERRLSAQEEQQRFMEANDFAQEQARLAGQIDGALKALRDARTELANYEIDQRQARAWLLPGLCLGLMVVAAIGLFIGAARKVRHESPRPYFVTAGVSFALSVLALVGVVIVNRGSSPASPEIAMGPAKTAPVATARPLDDVGGMAPGGAPLEPAEEAARADGAMRGHGGPVPALEQAPKDDPRFFDFPDAARPAPPAGLPAPAAPAMPGNRNAPKPDRAPGVEKRPAAPEDMKAKFNARPEADGKPKLHVNDEQDKLHILRLEQAQKGAAEKEADAFFKLEGDKKKLQEQMVELKEIRAKNAGEYERAGKQELAKKVESRMRRAEDLLKQEAERNMLRREGGWGLGLEAKDELRPLGGGGASRAGLDFGYAGWGGKRLGAVVPPAPPFIVREYAHQPITGEVRDDYAETVFWHPAIVLPQDGQKSIRFGLSAEVAKYQVIVAGHTLDGQIGATTIHLEARKPFSLDPKLPLEITSSDRVDVPVRVVNDSPERRVITFEVTPTGLNALNTPQPSSSPSPQSTLAQSRDRIALEPDAKGRKIISFQAAMPEGEAMVRVQGASEPFAPQDTINRTMKVVRDGFPMSGAFSDLLEKRAVKTIELPKDMVPGSLKMSLNVYPSTLADLQQGLEGLLREPHGCFEQTSTTSYPNTLILEYLQASDQTAPEASRRARELLERGYGRLSSFECQKPTGGREGYEWFGGAAPPHEALTAYGLLQFKDMMRVFPGVDADMVRRTQHYLLAMKDDAAGGFRRNARALDSFGGAPQHITDAYIVWALTESDPDNKEGMDLSRQLAGLKSQADGAHAGDPYFLALVSNALLNRPEGGNREHAIDYLKKIAAKQSQGGAIEGAQTSITRSGGRDLVIETTALAVLGWLKANEADKFQLPLQAAIKWISQQRGGHGGFGSTQSTILALKALIAHTQANKHPAEEGEITLSVGGKKFIKRFTKADRDVVTLEIPNPEEVCKAGVNDVVAEITTQRPYPFSLAWTCQALTPASAKECAVRLGTNLDRKEATEGETVRLNVTLENTLDKDHGMAVAVVGLPAGTKLPADFKQLTKLREDGVISYFETQGRELILYWRALAPKQKIDLNLDLICDVPGVYRGPASRGYLYYNADPKHWVEPISIRIAALPEE
jgi:A-macroglobulin TED domain/Alpha-2-macroglobulin family